MEGGSESTSTPLAASVPAAAAAAAAAAATPAATPAALAATGAAAGAWDPPSAQADSEGAAPAASSAGKVHAMVNDGSGGGGGGGGGGGDGAAEAAAPQHHKRLARARNPVPGQPASVSMLPIGVVRSCFRECRGTPRQGFFAPATRGRIEFDKKLQPDCTLGLEDFSHVWIVFLFHMNNNAAHNAAAQTKRGHNFKTKVKPPKLQGKSVGIFCTRTPHRPNAVGLTLAKLDRVDGRTLHISALDLTDGTPVLDVKPYVPVYDAVPAARCPAWCGERATHRQKVSFTCDALDAIDAAASSGKLKFYDNGADVRRAIKQLLENDVRPDVAYRRFSDDAQRPVLHFRFDMLKVGYVRLVELPSQSMLSEGALPDGTGTSEPALPHMQVCQITVETARDARAMELGRKPRY